MRDLTRCGLGLALALMLVAAGTQQAWAQGRGHALGHAHKGDELLVRFKEGVSPAAARQAIRAEGGRLIKRMRWGAKASASINRLYHVKLRRGQSVADALAAYKQHALIERVQPNYVYHKVMIPTDDPMAGDLWGLDNEGQTGGTYDADIDAPEGWDAAAGMAGEGVVVAVIDTGVDYTHPDLAGNMWVNEAELNGSNNFDDDNNGYVDDIYGYDFAYDDSDPMDGDGHGSHCSGSIAAVGNNGVGVIGVAGTTGHVEIMACKFLDDNGSGSTADAIDAINYAVMMGADVLSNSWGGGGFEAELENAIQLAYEAGAIFIAAAGNNGTDNDSSPHYPSSYEVDGIIAVAASDHDDLLADFSCYGATSVDLAAPGVAVLSTVPYSDGYDTYDGTSMATPHVSGAAALAFAYGAELWPDDWGTLSATGKVIAVKQLVLDSADPRPALTGLMTTGARLNVGNMLTGTAPEIDSTAPSAVGDLAAINAGDAFVTFSFTAPEDDAGDANSGAATSYALRYAPADAWVDFDHATPADGLPAPGAPGTLQYASVTGLQLGTSYTFQLRAMDEWGNASYSNLVTESTTGQVFEAFYDGMESGDGSGWAAQGSWAVTQEKAHAGSYAWSDSPYGDYANYTDAAITFEVDLTGLSSPTLEFWQWLDVEGATYDRGYVEISTDGGSSWEPLADYADNATAWELASIDLGGYSGLVKIRFRLQTDYSIVYDGWYIDDVRVFGSESDTTTPDVVVAQDDFSTVGAWVLESPWGLDGGALADSPGGKYADDTRAAAVRPLDLSGVSRAYLSFDLEVDTEESYDFLHLEISTDGSGWKRLASWTGQHGWHAESFDISAFAAIPTVQLRFLFESDYSINTWGVEIDNLLVEGVTGNLNEAPVATDDGGFDATEDTIYTSTVSVLANDTDADGPDALTAVLASDAAHGSVTLASDGFFSYTPDADFNGTDAFTYKAFDGLAYSAAATVTITVSAEQDAPVAVDDQYSLDEDGQLSIAAPGVLGNDEDVDGDSLSASLVDDVTSGTLVLQADGWFSYVPDPNFNGTDSFTYVANDGTQDSNVASVTITVNPVNDAPTADDDAYATDEDTLLSVVAPGVLDGDSDTDGDPLAAVLNSGPANGSLTLHADGSFEYTPNADFNGSDSFTYVANDGTQDSNEATVTITVNPVNDPPVAVDDAYTVERNKQLTGNVLANDTDVDSTMTAALVSGPSSGTVTLNTDGSFTYTPTQGFVGIDSFTYTAGDGEFTDQALVEITVVNAAPVAYDDAYSTDEDTALSIAAPGVLGNDTDSDGDPLTAVLKSGPANGSLTLDAGGSFDYTPNANFVGSDTFTYAANDGTQDSNEATVTITVNPENDAPVAADDTYSVDEDGQLTIATPGVLGNDDDVDGDSLSASLVSGVTNGTLDLYADGSFSYVPNADWSGTDSFIYVANDGTVDSNEATVTITVNSVNDAPVAADDDATTNEDTPVTIDVLANDSDDADGDVLSVSSVGDPANGSATVNADDTITYTPNANWSGADSFTYTISDGNGGSDTATVSVTVNPVNDAPVAADDAASTDQDVAVMIDVLANDADIDGDSLSVSSVGAPANGTASSNGDGTITYAPNAGFTGTDSFTYTITDGELASSAVVTVTVNPVASDPTVSVDAITYVGFGGRFNDKHLDVYVSLADEQGSPVAGAVVTVQVFRNGSLFSEQSATTDSAGDTVYSFRSPPSGTYTTVVTSVSAAGYIWDGATPSNSYTK